MGIGGHLQDPTLSIPLITDTLSGLFELGDMIRMRNNPNVRNLQNIGIGGSNTLLNEARNGGAKTPFSNMSEYTRRQIGGSQDTYKPFADSLSNIGKPGEFKLPDMSGGFGDTSMYSKPYQTTLDRTMSGSDGANVQNFKPAGPGFIERAGDWLGNLLPKFEVGVTSVPQTMPAIVHEGEMIVPKEQNPLAGTPPVPMRGNAPNQRGAIPPPPAISAPPAAPAPLAQVQNPMQQAQPQQRVNNVSLAPNMNLPQGGLNPEMQQLLAQRNNEQVNQQMMSQQRQLREQAATGGNIGGGDLQNQLFQSRLAADSARNNFSRDLAISAEDRRFADEMAKAQFGLQQQGTLGGLGLQQRELDLQRQLGEGDLALRNRGQNQQYDLGQQELGLGRDRLGLDRYSTERQLGLQERSTALEEQLGRGRLGLDSRAQTLSEQLGRGGLDLQNRQFGLDSRLGLGQLGIQQQQANLQGELGRGQLNLDSRLGLGQLGIQQQQANLQGELGRGQLGLDRQAQNFQQGTAFNESRRQFNEDARIRELIANGQISLGNRGMDLQELGQQTDTQFGQYDRNYRSFWDSLNRQDSLAGLNTQANQGSEDFIQQFLNRLYGQSGLPQAAGSGA